MPGFLVERHQNRNDTRILHSAQRVLTVLVQQINACSASGLLDSQAARLHDVGSTEPSQTYHAPSPGYAFRCQVAGPWVKATYRGYKGII